MRRSNVGPLVDELGLLEAQIADIETKAQPLRDQIKAMGAGAYEGDLFRAVVSEYERKNLNMKAVKKKLSPQFIRAHTKYTPTTSLTVNGRNAIDVTTEGDD
ncbi:hypothetical protein HAP48_0042860 [Bradyrhizobium septentrionale]|uniref:Uncharacterized protein n=1 Tax=Bradyrhizobium septentrionale TaxID=1404411 RepID=A0A973W395_9BRAD|nr:hypothetical protein [Bradyrhizobium septentrionale]UGY15199.1 hypothetical protein HAP48_0042860 [Bradyrhizobium septentrionale]